MITNLKKPSRKTRTKLRKPKFLSLRLQLNKVNKPPMPTTTTDQNKQQLINLFPLHPENLVEQYKLDEEQHNNMACIFSSCDDVDKAATTLTGILCSDDDDGAKNTNNPSPSSVNYADDDVDLVRTAMRRNNKERNNNNIEGDEKWVCYSEIRGMSSSSGSTTSCYHHRSKLALKLDYEKIMKTWVNKGPLYVHGDSGMGMGMDAPQPQTVPDIHDDDLFFPSNGSRHDQQDNGATWTVPEMAHTENNGISKGDDALQVGESITMTHNREASVQRYKEKRRNRLFSKTIRYEVRKLNAEKRPRIKGRFVKRN
ncbi:putative transcription factor C2C2-CO-like family [Helianthus annuus]|nr:putative transcription factor C2C2-CO-like family [Helianthus annuus]KAJ0447293.1 putative transcription factor C2C2-CO-like family [Helianthus annuus]KAJ0636074.1 putative transcription factor C2C2-CO-like family [Helianthus annuus]KAJ0826047.1 putative transcription factor C2C2-CO-like family [Helianthus annuus]